MDYREYFEVRQRSFEWTSQYGMIDPDYPSIHPGVCFLDVVYSSRGTERISDAVADGLAGPYGRNFVEPFPHPLQFFAVLVGQGCWEVVPIWDQKGRGEFLFPFVYRVQSQTHTTPSV